MMLRAVSFIGPEVRSSMLMMTMGGSSASTLKKLKGAALTTPAALTLVTSAMGRGTTRLVSSS